MFKLWLYRIKRPYHFFKTGLLNGFLANQKFGQPLNKLKVLAITGTDGKTTTASILHHILSKSGIKAGLITTVSAKLGTKEVDTGAHVTSPPPNMVIEFAHLCLKENCQYLVVEITSHGYYQYRTWAIKPLITGLTNITNEHLDYHLNFDEYLKTKACIAKDSRQAIMMSSAPGFEKIKKIVPNLKSFSERQYLSTAIKQAVITRFPSKHNQHNAQLAVQIAAQLKIKEENIVKAIETFPQVVGRMETIPNQLGFKIVVDFAHTPYGLRSTLSALKKELKTQKKKGRLIAVYGSAGLRDREKRPQMGQIGVELADLVIFTAEDPRTESVWSIIRQMKEQLTTGHDKVVSIADRTKAIAFALTHAKVGDIVAVLGKGHEKSMCFGKTELPWSDHAVIKQAIKELTYAK